MDYLRELGNLALASRLKRVVSSFVQDAKQIYRHFNIQFEPVWFPVFHLLFEKRQALALTEISNALGISHPAVINTVQALKGEGLVESHRDRRDARKNMIRISVLGQQLGEELRPIWESIDRAVDDLIGEIDFDLLAVIERMERALEKKPLNQRVIDQVNQQQYHKIEILPYQSQYKSHFYRINAEWLEDYFSVEEGDRILLENPEREIIEKGGEILFARLEDSVVGTCALLPMDGSRVELSKMGVLRKMQGKRIGAKLTDAAIRWARDNGIETIYLKTNRLLKKAVRMYHRFGFVQTREYPFPKQAYEREKDGIVMVLDLTEGLERGN